MTSQNSPARDSSPSSPAGIGQAYADYHAISLAPTESVGIRELKRDASAIVRTVRDEKQVIDVTYRGEIVARIIPVERPDERQRRLDEFSKKLAVLRKEVSERWMDGMSAVEAVREQRREL